MNTTHQRRAVAGVLSTMALSTLCACATSLPSHESPQQRDGKFHNVVPREAPGFGKTMSIMWRIFTEKPATTVPQAAIPVRKLTAADLAAAPDASLFRLGHSTMLLKLA